MLFQIRMGCTDLLHLLHLLQTVPNPLLLQEMKEMKEMISAVPIWERHVFPTSEPRFLRRRLAHPPAAISTIAREMAPPRPAGTTNQLRHPERGSRCDRPLTHPLRDGRRHASRKER